MERDYEQEIKNRVAFIQNALIQAKASGIVYGNSGGKDCTLVSILCKMACDNTLSLMLPCSSKRNYKSDLNDAILACKQYQIDYRIVDLTPVKEAQEQAIASAQIALNQQAIINIAPRLRMTTLYAVAQAENRLVAGTGNRSEIYMGYFTKWGDGASDFNPIADLTVTEIFEFLRYLKAPQGIIDKAPSGGLFDSQTDEEEMGVTYKEIDSFLLHKQKNDNPIIERMHRVSHHKRDPFNWYWGEGK